MRYLHTMLRVRNLDAALDFYCKKLGLKEARRIDSETESTAAASLNRLLTRSSVRTVSPTPGGCAPTFRFAGESAT